MAYDSSKDPLASAGIQNSGIARVGQLLVGDDSTDYDDYVVATVVAAGDIKFLPAGNDDGDPIVITAAPVGYIVPWQIRRLFSTGTTATLWTLEKVY